MAGDEQEWKHMHIADILSMPDKWEYPFFGLSTSLALLFPAFS